MNCIKPIVQEIANADLAEIEACQELVQIYFPLILQ